MTNQSSSIASIKWRTRVGGLQSRSSIIINGDQLYVGTCGESWNIRDRRDGIHCFNLMSGKENWFTPTLSDVNEIAVAGEDLIAPTDNGDVFVLDRRTGEIRVIAKADSAVFGKPIIYEGSGRWSALIASYAGGIYRMESGSEKLERIGNISGGLRASLVAVGNDTVIAATEDGRLHKVKIGSDRLQSHAILQLPESDFGSVPAITATPLINGNLAFVGFARDTYYDSAAVACVDYMKEKVIWLAPKCEMGLGNVRSTPVIVDGLLVVASAYSDSVQILNPLTGVLVDEVRLGQTVFQQWSGPVIVGPHHVALGRVDGVCSIVDVRNRRLISSISLVTADIEKVTPLPPNFRETTAFELYPGEPAPMGAICTQPAFDWNRLTVGTTDGSLVIIDIDLDGARRPRSESAGA